MSIQPPAPHRQGIGIGGLRTIVRQEHKHRLVVLTGFFQVSDEPANVKVHGLGHGCINLHATRLIGFVRGTQRIPSHMR